MKLHRHVGNFSSQLTSLLYALVLAVVAAPACLAQAPVLTHRNDNSRTGQNLSETYLTPSVVNSTHFGQLFVQPLDGMAVAEPLYVPNLQINGTTHNVVFIVTLHDGVYAFDADNNEGSNSGPLWYTSLIDPPDVTTVPIAEQGCVGHNFTEMGILGTPVIDPTSNTMYLVAKTKESGSYVFRLHALNIQTGQEALGSPVRIQASYNSDGDLVTFTEQHRMNRPALLLSNGVIYIEFGTMGCKSAAPSTGWMMAYSASNLQQLGVLDVGPTQGNTPGIWMGGEGASVDSNGDIYVVTGDGAFDYDIGGLDYGSSLLKVDLDSGQFSLIDSFTPYNQDYLNKNDLDLGSGALVLLPPQPGPYPNLGVLGGKGGLIYLINEDSLGGYNPVVDQVLQEVPFSPTQLINLDGGATYWNQNIYFGGVADGDIGVPVEMFSLSNGMLSTSPVAMTAKTYKFFSLFSLSANGANNGILWGVQAQNTGSTLNAFNATTLASLFQSPQFGSTLHFVTPMIANGRVYVTTKNSVVVMGLFNLNVTVGGNNQTGGVGTALNKPLSVRVTNAYTGAAMPGVTINFSDGGSGGTFGNAHPATNSNGYASTTYTLPVQSGAYKITASATGFTTAHFTEKATGD